MVHVAPLVVAYFVFQLKMASLEEEAHATAQQDMLYWQDVYRRSGDRVL